MAVVQDTYIGNTHIIIRDDCIVSPENQQKILKRCGEIAARQYSSIAREQQSDDKTA
ncbi:MAG: hypothetical protein K0Q87_4208 [Neobacillus sp.]|jgi:hypothetical protein|nr:hypothetical protein [Neobacillus sp.]